MQTFSSRNFVSRSSLKSGFSEAYLTDESAEMIVRAATLRQKLNVKLAISPSHNVLTPSLQVVALTLLRQTPGGVASRIPVFESLVGLDRVVRGSSPGLPLSKHTPYHLATKADLKRWGDGRLFWYLSPFCYLDTKPICVANRRFASQVKNLTFAFRSKGATQPVDLCYLESSSGLPDSCLDSVILFGIKKKKSHWTSLGKNVAKFLHNYHI